MSVKQVQQKKKDFVIHDFDAGLDHTLKTIEKELSIKNAELIKRYDKEMVRNSLAKGTRHNISFQVHLILFFFFF